MYNFDKKKYFRKLAIGLPIFCVVLGGTIVGLKIGLDAVNTNYNAIVSHLVPNHTFVTEADKEITKESGIEMARQMVREGAVLLRNENNLLPLSKSVNKVNVFGHGSVDWLVGGSGSGACNPEPNSNTTFLLPALKEYGIEYNPDLANYYNSFKSSDGVRNSIVSYYNEFYQLVEPKISEYQSILNASKTYSDTAFVVIGRRAGETEDPPRTQYKFKYSSDSSRHTQEISTEEEELLTYVGANFENVVVIINSLNTFETEFMERIPGLDSCIYLGGSGNNGAYALAQLIYGDYSPSGRLADTIPYDFAYNINYNHSGIEMINHYTNGKSLNLYPYGISGRNAGVSTTDNAAYIDYLENIYVGYKWFETADAEGYWNNSTYNGYEKVVQYPFGYGLSYTTFSWQVVSSQPEAGSSITNTDKIKLTVRVTNTGNYAGQDVVQAYVTAPYKAGGIEKSHVSLVGIGKTINLQPGEIQDLVIEVNASDFKSYDCYDANKNGHTGYELEAGDYQLKLMSNSHVIHKMISAGAERDAILTYRVSETINADLDEITGNEVKNLFTGSNLADEASVDGIDDGVRKEDIISRNNFPQLSKTKTADRPISEKGRKYNLYTKSMATEWDNATVDVFGNNVNLTKPSFGVGTAEKLFNGSTPTALGLQLGKDYNDPRWETVLDAIPFNEAYNLAASDNAWSEQALPSVGHTSGFHDYDGPCQIRSYNAGENRGTGYPNATVLAQTFSPLLAYKFGLSYGTDMDSKGAEGIYGFGCNIHRSPFQGRNFEYLSEDGFLSGIILQNEIKGLNNKGKYTFLKHLCLAENEHERESTYIWVTEQALREIYLKPFQMAIENEGCVGLMSSYNRIGSNWTGASEALITGVCRNEWGFKGAIITDYSDHKQYMNHEASFRAGGNFGMATDLKNSKSFGGFTSSSSNRLLNRLRDSTHQALYMWLNPQYKKSIYDPSLDDFGGTVNSFTINGWDWIKPTIPVIITIVFIGYGIGLYFIVRPKPIEEEDE